MPLLLVIFGYDKSQVFSYPYQAEANFPFYKQEIFQKSEAIDLLFVGPCTTWWQVLPTAFIEAYEQKKQRTPVIVNLGYNHSGEELTYLLVRETLNKRKVKTLVLTTPRPNEMYEFPHPNSFMFWNHFHDIKTGPKIDLVTHFQLYGVSVMGAIRHLPFLAFKNSYPPHLDKFSTYGEKIREPAGTQTEWHFRGDFKNYFFSNWDQQQMTLGRPISEREISFLKATVHLAQSHGIQVVFLSSPLREDFETGKIEERANWFQLFDNIKFVGIPASKIRAENPETWEQMLLGNNLSPEASMWFSRKWAQIFVEHL
ncbi:MAG: hypothetical protein AB7O96_05255 [Pseudobdellovibrionaceae bacterium]